MKTTNKLTLALAGLTLAAGLHAQSTTTAVPAPRSVASSSSAGLIGTPYTELKFGVQDIKGNSSHAYSIGAGANTVLVPRQLDGGASYAYSRIGGASRGHTNTIGGYLTAYAPTPSYLNDVGFLRSAKPFISANAGWEWSSYPTGSDDQPLWGASVGIEIPAGAVTITPRLSYSDDFEGTSRSSQSVGAAVEVNYWYSPTMAFFGSAGESGLRHSNRSARNFFIGLRSRL
ncbi:MAG: hypothetical protein Q8N18_14060 [Opitutaceae bacterium]|nr:hypothetical protein [Opitutaceae bacterium]